MESSFQFKQDIEKSFSRELSASMCGVRTGLLGFAVCVVTRQRLLKRLSQCYPVWNKNFESFCILYIYIFFGSHWGTRRRIRNSQEEVRIWRHFQQLLLLLHISCPMEDRWVQKSHKTIQEALTLKIVKRIRREVLVGGDITLVSLGTYLVVLVRSGVA